MALAFVFPGQGSQTPAMRDTVAALISAVDESTITSTMASRSSKSPRQPSENSAMLLVTMAMRALRDSGLTLEGDLWAHVVADEEVVCVGPIL